MYKSSSILVLSIWTALTYGGYPEAVNEAERAVAAKDLPAAAAKYLEAEKLAANGAQWFDAFWKRYMMFRANQKNDDAASVLKEALPNPKLSAPNRRKALNHLGALLLWSKPDETLLHLGRAVMIPTDFVNDRSETYLTMAYLYITRRRPEYAADILQKVIADRETHPANLCTAHLLIGQGYLALGRKDDAAESFRQAVSYGKKVQYTFDYSAAEKALAEIDR